MKSQFTMCFFVRADTRCSNRQILVCSQSKNRGQTELERLQKDLCLNLSDKSFVAEASVSRRAETSFGEDSFVSLLA